MDAGLKQLKVIGRGEVGSRKRVPLAGGHGNKRLGNSVASILIQFDSEGRLGVLTKRALRVGYDFF